MFPLIPTLDKLLHNEVQGSLFCLSFHSQGGPFNLFQEQSAKEGVSHLLKCLVQPSFPAFCFANRIWEKEGQWKKNRLEKEAEENRKTIIEKFYQESISGEGTPDVCFSLKQVI